MPTYSYHCDKCDSGFDRILPISLYNEPQNCPECGEGPARKLVTPIGFILKGNDWTGKNLKIKRQMEEKNKHLDAKQRERAMDGSGGVRLVPNVDGERVDSWSEASKLASSKGKDTSGYDKIAAKVDKKP